MVESHRCKYGRHRRARVPTRTTKLSQFCHGCGQSIPKPLWLRWHQCPCGISAQRDLYSADLSAYLDPPEFLPSCAQSRYAACWEGREPGLRPRIRARDSTRECEAACTS